MHRAVFLQESVSGQEPVSLGRLQGGSTAGSTDLRQGTANAASDLTRQVLSIAFAGKGSAENLVCKARPCSLRDFDCDSRIRKHRITKCGLLPKNQHLIIK